MKKKRWYLIVCSFVLALCIGFMIPQTADAAVTKTSLKNKINNKLPYGETIIKTYYYDYDGNGKYELFAVTEDDNYTNNLWFASSVETKKIALPSGYSPSFCVSSRTAEVSSKQRLFIAEVSCGGSGSGSVCCYVSSGHVYKVNQKLEGLKKLTGKKFAIHVSAFDSMRDSSGIKGGHTYKRYYLKWTGTKFVEYTGTAISTTTLKSYTNGKSVLTKIKNAGYSVTKIYKRKNGIININCKKSSNGFTYYENVTLKYASGKVTTKIINSNASNYVLKSSYGGSYKASGLPK